MQRLLTEILAYFGRLARTTQAAWDRFVFTPADPTSLGLIRLVVGGLAFWSLLVYGLDLDAFFGSDAWSNPDAVRLKALGDPAHWSFWFLVPDAWLRFVWVLCLAILGMLTLGLWSRVTAVLAWTIIVSTVRRSPVSIYGFDQIISTWLLYLAATGASGQAVSLDRYFARLKRNRSEVARRSKTGVWTAPSGVPEPTITANIAIRLIQCHLVVIYGMAALAKFRGTSWWVGDAFWGTIASSEFRLFDLTWLAAYPWLINVGTHAALAAELTYPILIWINPLRPLILGVIILMHLGIGLTLGLTEFSLAMIAGNLVFVSGPWLRSLFAGRTPGMTAGRVLYDGACPRCRASMAIITAGDPDRLIEPVDLTAVDVATIHPSLTKDACLKSMHLVHANGLVESGYDAVMTILSWTPLFSLVSLVRFIPGVSRLGRVVYDKIAASRPRDVCNDEICGLHPPAAAKAKSTATPTGRNR